MPIPGTTKLHRLEENIAAADQELTPSNLPEIEMVDELGYAVAKAGGADAYWGVDDLTSRRRLMRRGRVGRRP